MPKPGEQVELPKGVERFLVAVCPEHGQRTSGYRKCAAGRVGVSLGCDRDTEVVETIRRSDLPAILAQRDSEWRSGLELDVLCGELQRIAEEGKVPSPSEHGLAVDVLTWAEGWLLQLSAIDKAAPDGGGGS